MAGPHGCTGTTRKGKPCGAWPLKGQDVCLSHSDQETRASVSFGGVQAGGGRPRNPRAVDVLRERIEASIDKWLKPLEEALDADKPVVADGEVVGMLPDHAIRLRAVADGFDRAFGKPRQSSEISGPDGKPLGAMLISNQTLAEDARALLRRAASVSGDEPGGPRPSDE